MIVDISQYVSAAREMSAIIRPTKSWWDNRQDTRDRVFWGLVGEFIVAEFLGTSVKEPTPGPDPGYDGVYKNLKYDVKVSTYLGDTHLKVHHTYKIKADVYILVAINKRTLLAEIIGYATGDELAAADKKDYGYGDTRFITRSNLHKIEELL